MDVNQSKKFMFMWFFSPEFVYMVSSFPHENGPKKTHKQRLSLPVPRQSSQDVYLLVAFLVTGKSLDSPERECRQHVRKLSEKCRLKHTIFWTFFVAIFAYAVDAFVWWHCPMLAHCKACLSPTFILQNYVCTAFEKSDKGADFREGDEDSNC